MKLTKADNGYILQNEAEEQLVLTAEELAELVRDVHHRNDLQLRYRPAMTLKVQNVSLGLDAHHSQLLLKLEGMDGTETVFEIAHEKARVFSEALARKIAQIEAAQSKKTEH